MKRMLLIMAGGLLLSLPVQAQTAAAPRPLQNAPVTVVTLTGLLAPVRAGDPPLPFEMLQQVERDPFLARMHTEPRVNTGPALFLTYTFPSVDAYRAWAEAAETRRLMEVLRQRVSQFELTVSLTRSPGGSGIPARS
jgi:hypothetical protein